ncbi:MAG: magnesium transporter [Cryomorphaceae bacterium]|nr:MAG: magnesium transporter [Cryomorphaceae bacterium]|tara:strand:- start:714 stop:2072 length:1359 start_codon:yes stop_codon:yes gene_type:complete
MKTFELSKEIIQEISNLISNKKNKEIKKLVDGIHYADLAEIINELESTQRIYLIKIIDSDKTSDVLTEVDEDVREEILKTLSEKEIAGEIKELDSDDAVDILSELSDEKQEKVISLIKDESITENIRELLNYDEDSAGGLMAKELISVNENWSVLKCLREIRKQAKDIKRVHSIYVLNKKKILIGRLSLKDLITSPSKSKIQEIYIPKVDYVHVNDSADEVAKLMSKYDLEAIPVVGDNNELLGRITIDDIVDFIKDEAEEDYLLAAGISNDVEADDSIFELTKARLPWLILGLFGGLGSVFILESFENIMASKELRALFFYTPLIAAMAGNVGVQSSAIVVQGLANDVIKGSLISRLIKEVSLTILNGLILSIIIILFGLIINQSLEMSITISVSMIFVIIVAALIGTSVPIILDKFGIDPAIATGPFITTGNDVIGILLFFYIAKLILVF